MQGSLCRGAADQSCQRNDTVAGPLAISLQLRAAIYCTMQTTRSSVLLVWTGVVAERECVQYAKLIKISRNMGSHHMLIKKLFCSFDQSCRV